MDEITAKLEEIELLKVTYKKQMLDDTSYLPPLTQNDIIQIGLDVIEKTKHLPDMIRYCVFMLMANGDDRIMYAVKKWLESIGLEKRVKS